ncbi:MAG TPA: hypothetical protein VHF25_13790 [Nitriliruptorales bacterium]|nr:hypothetical protein [Nitriliruptorales bacterium]
MTYLVRYRTPAGDPRLEDVDDLPTAVERVERLRNDDGVTDVRVFREVPLEFRPYYRAAIVEESAAGQAPTPEAAAGDTPPPGAMPLRPAPQAAAAQTPTRSVEASEPRRASLFHRGAPA